MNNRYIWQFILLLSLILTALGLYSFSEKTYTLADFFPSLTKAIKEQKVKDDVVQLADSTKNPEHRHKLNDIVHNIISAEIQKSEIKETIMPAEKTNFKMLAESQSVSGLSLENKKDSVSVFFPALDSVLRANILSHKVDTTSQKILLIGDSMLEGLSLRLQDYSEHNGHELQTVIWYSSQSEWFGKTDTLKYYIRKFKPTFVILVLGANELFVPKIIEKRQKYVEHIISQLDSVNFIWVGPPNWKDDTGINKLIADNVGWTRYFPSKNLKYKRTKDGAHPTYESAGVWMDSVATWVMNKSKYPIKLLRPVKKREKSPKRLLLSPWS